MKIIISNVKNQPIYEQIYEQIKNLIITEELKAGEMLPSIRGLAKDLRISVITTKRAYDELEKDGFINSVAGKGCFVAKQKGSIEKKLLEEFKLHAAAAMQAGISLGSLTSVLEQLAEEQKERSDKE